MNVKVLLSPEEAMESLHVGRTTIYSMLKSGELRSIRVGKKLRRIPVSELQAYVQRKLEAQRPNAAEVTQ